MPKFSVDYSKLSSTVNKDVFKLSEVKDRLEKIAFDVVRFKDGDPEELWQIQSADDGDFIVSRYDTKEDKVEKTASVLDWDVMVSKASGDINIFYKGYPVIKTTATQVGVSAEDLDTVKRFMPKELNANKAFVKLLLKTLTTTAKYELLRMYPELS